MKTIIATPKVKGTIVLTPKKKKWTIELSKKQSQKKPSKRIYA